jgi:hypothetical protein
MFKFTKEDYNAIPEDAYSMPEDTYSIDDLVKMSDYFDSDIDYKFNERKLIEEFQEYIDSTYQSHYSKDKFQATEFIIDGGHGTGFCVGNVLKYAQRYGKKGSVEDARKDLMKVLHYALIQLYIHDTTNEVE